MPTRLGKAQTSLVCSRCFGNFALTYSGLSGGGNDIRGLDELNKGRSQDDANALFGWLGQLRVAYSD